jgi:hypothetical protein
LKVNDRLYEIYNSHDSSIIEIFLSFWKKWRIYFYFILWKGIFKPYDKISIIFDKRVWKQLFIYVIILFVQILNHIFEHSKCWKNILLINYLIKEINHHIK